MENIRWMPASCSIASSLSGEDCPTSLTIFAPSFEDTEIENTSCDSEAASTDDDASSDVLAMSLNVLECQLLATLRHDLTLATQLMPQIYHEVQFVLAQNGAVVVDYAPSDGNCDSSRSVPVQELLTSSTSIHNTPATRPRKHDREEEEDPNDSQGNGRNQKMKLSSLDASDEVPNFACHFHKRWPEKYHPASDPDYLYCLCPLKKRELRRIK